MIKLAEITDKGKRYYVIYPTPAPPRFTSWFALDADTLTIASFEGKEDELDAPARAAIERGDGVPLEERLECVKSSWALGWGEGFGWLIKLDRFGAAEPEFIHLTTPVWFPGGAPDGLRERPVRDTHEALFLLARCIGWGEGKVLPPGATAPAEGVVLTAAELAAVK